jgi:fructose-bisphosphate aldolase class II
MRTANHDPLGVLLGAARAGGYAVPAINVVDVTSMDGVILAAVEQRSPVIVQTAAATARIWGPSVLAAAFTALVARAPVDAILQLDHCSDLILIDACLEAGWNAVLFDGSALARADNVKATMYVVHAAHAGGASVEGELEAIRGHEAGVAGGRGPTASLDENLAFIEATGIDCFAPSIGNIHGRTEAPPDLDIDLVGRLTAASPVPLALHGGTGIPTEILHAAIGAGCSKVNVSTALREACRAAIRSALAADPASDDPVPVLTAVREAARATAAGTMRLLGSAGRSHHG